MPSRLIRPLSLLIGLFLTHAPSLQAQDTPNFNPERFNIELSLMLPAAYPLKTLSYGYYITLQNDTASVCLPYIGRVYQPGFDCDGLTFDLPVKQYNVTTQGNDTKVEFKVKKAAATYRFVVTAYPDGRADILMTPEHAQSISYSGSWNNGR